MTRILPLANSGRVVLVDDQDYDLASRYRWRRCVRRGIWYARRSYREDGRVKSQFLHTLLTGWAEVDHIDHDGLNNQRRNLRSVTRAQNGANRRVQRAPKTSRFKGVHHVGNRWRARIRVHGQLIQLGYWQREEMAAHAYDIAAVQYFGEHACLNFEGATR